MDIWVVPTFWLLWIVLLRTFVYRDRSSPSLSPSISPTNTHTHTHTLKWKFLKVKRDSFYFFLFELHPQPHVHNRILIKIRFSKIFWEIPEKIRMEWSKDKYFLDLWEDNIRKYHIMWFNEDSWKKYIIKFGN